MHSQRALFTQPRAQGRVFLAAARARSHVSTTRPKQQQVQVQQPSKARQTLEKMNMSALSMLMEKQRSVTKAAARIQQLADQLDEHEAAQGLMSTKDFMDQQQEMLAAKARARRGSRSARARSLSSKPQDKLDKLLAMCMAVDAQIGDVQETIGRLALSPEPTEADAINIQEQHEQQPLAAAAMSDIQQQMFAAYRQTTDDVPEFIELLRLPEQTAEYEEHMQDGMLLVHLPGAATQPGSGCDAISAEQLAWQDQQSSMLFSKVQEVAEVTKEEVVEVVTEDSHIANKNTIKVEVRIKMPTRPGQDILLAGSHPALGSWSLD